jgi:hypothetical protein
LACLKAELPRDQSNPYCVQVSDVGIREDFLINISKYMASFLFTSLLMETDAPYNSLGLQSDAARPLGRLLLNDSTEVDDMLKAKYKQIRLESLNSIYQLVPALPAMPLTKN